MENLFYVSDPSNKQTINHLKEYNIDSHVL